ncbi:MAG: diaminopimelate epimerase [Acidobacteria bacterium]|nr:diaminopimelate epimerase [Acidobacteriota bacterium]MCA1627566.1 diaminopimelate epimerase [Acidobacteriota bacterium]
MPPKFTKFHGLGNDYLVIEADQLTGIDDLGEFARRICDRHYGAGGDGIAIISKSQSADADFKCRIFNPDGSEAGLSGNGTRCAVAYLYYAGHWSGDELRLSTRTGLKRYFPRGKDGPGKFIFESELGRPKFDSPSIPMSISPPLDQVIGHILPVDGQPVPVTAMQMGNPNCCIFVDDFDVLNWRKLGKTIETHPQFPDRTNVVFVRVRERALIELRIWERGVGETTASGTCSCAGAVAAMINEKADRDVKVIMEGGEVRIHWRPDGEVVITGTAELVYSGEWLA